MPRPRSLRRDLALGFSAGIVLTWLIALLVGWTILRSEIDEVYDAALGRTADRILAIEEIQRGTPGRSDLLARMIGPEGQVLFRSRHADGALFDVNRNEGFSDAGNMRLLTLKTEGGGLLQVAAPLEERSAAARETLAGMLLPSVLLLPLAFLGVSWFTRRRLAPVDDLSREVAGRDARDLRPLGLSDLPAELKPIQRAVDQLMAQLDIALTAERDFSSNAAHELRTPIAAALAQTQRLVAETRDPAARARAEGIATSLRRLSPLSEKLLDLARAEGMTGRDHGLHDMVPVMRLLVSDFDGRVRLELAEDPAPIAMDIDAFAVLARNLIENALVHGLPPVVVRLSKEALVVENSGPPISPEALAKLTHRFERAGSQKRGSGLGLAIVETIAHNTDASLHLTSPAPGKTDGLRAEVRFKSSNE
ncbi:histidine kinase dimerization/phospho-acceptor domain-containing protein [Paracoccus sp. MBLB3053]|uniref:histidine kinase n=1 Tax=Paracoccus aurantius TaxID=3073814 RepID=A0ABU2HXV9_9RHOB|nr:ATP-binding protein [Paracoccus sp. MBLB3053]MDS9469878.1 histidine kinase dimerization/phospho-acceptor domain-containing protein [Paracoccus sp. MBLB3053]